MTIPSIPPVVVVAGQSFALTLEPRSALDGALGRTDAVTQRIRIAEENGPDARRETVMHEVVHAIRILGGLPRREREVGVLAVQLVDVLRRNPELVRFLLDGVE